jgi:uncharacterized protein (DUF1330 family)
MTAYALASLHNPAPNPDVAEYIERIQATLDPFGGRFLVHGAQHEVTEGSWDGAVVLIAFPGMDEARSWWDSPAYRQIAPLRTDHIESDIILVDGVPDGYEPGKTAARMRELL